MTITKPFFRGTLLLTFFSISLFSQAAPPQISDAARLGFYRHIFKLVANPLESTATRERRVHQVALRFGMNQTEEAAFDTIAHDCYAASLTVHQSVMSLMAGRTVSSASDQSTLAALNTQQMQGIQQWATRLEGAVRPEIVARFSIIWNSPVGNNRRN